MKLKTFINGCFDCDVGCICRAVLRDTYIRDLSRQHPRVRETEPASHAGHIAPASVSLLCSCVLLVCAAFCMLGNVYS